MKFAGILKRLLVSRRRGGAARRRRDSRLPRLDELKFSVIPASDDYFCDQDVRPALLAQILTAERSR